MKINERSKFIINELIKRNTYVTASEIADLLQVSIKTVTRQLVNVEKILNENDLILERKTRNANYMYLTVVMLQLHILVIIIIVKQFMML